tara:strand:- start:8501 stop:9040 length:540 start_codon:yes stop_codon:yes gene_type:complete
MVVTDNDLEEHYRSRSQVSKQIETLENEGVEVDYIIYYKVSEDMVPSSNRLWMDDSKGRRSDRPVSKPEGWLLHVIYFKDISVLEYYSRSQSMTEVESDGILIRNVGESRWVKGKPPSDDDTIIQAHVFPVSFYREDLAIYANVKSDSILLFDPRLDERIHRLQTEKAEREAPESLDGF